MVRHGLAEIAVSVSSAAVPGIAVCNTCARPPASAVPPPWIVLTPPVFASPERFLHPNSLFFCLFGPCVNPRSLFGGAANEARFSNGGATKLAAPKICASG